MSHREEAKGIINGREMYLGKTVGENITFDEVTRLAYPPETGMSQQSRDQLTVTWSRGQGSGSAGVFDRDRPLVVSEGMVFSAIHTGNA